MGMNLDPIPASHEMVQDMAVAVGLTEKQRLLLCDLGTAREARDIYRRYGGGT